MFIDSKGKLFGKISIIDVVIIIVAILIAAGIYVRFAGAGKAVTSNEDFYYTIKVDNIRKQSVDALNKSVGLKFSLNEKQQSEMGELLSVKVSDAVGVIEKTDGTVVNAPIPDRFDVMLEFKVSGRVNEKGYYTPQLREINAGTTYVIKSKYSTVYGIVQTVSSKDE